MIVRPCLPSDAEQIEALFHEFVDDLRQIGDQTVYRFSAAQYLEDGFGSDPAFRGLVAEDGSRLIGYALFCRTYEGDYVRSFYLIDLYVRRVSRGHGIGHQLIDAVRTLGRDEGIARLSWDVHKNNAGAIRFYERLGAHYSSDTHVMWMDVSV